MKRYIQATTVTKPNIVEYLKGIQCKESTVTDAQINDMAQEIYEVIKDEESEMGERYESLEDADIEGLCDSSSTDLHDLYYDLRFGTLEE